MNFKNKKIPFEEWLNTFTTSFATYEYYTDFNKIYSNISKYKIELNILNSLIASKDIKNDFINIITSYPKTLECIPILIAKRLKDCPILVKTAERDFEYNFKKMNYSIDDYITFMEKTGIFNLLENHLVNNLYDYVTGVEVGLDSHGRKNRTGTLMENIVEEHLISLGLEKNVNYFVQFSKSNINEKFGINSEILELESENKREKRYDFVVNINNRLYIIETNYFNRGGSKLNEIGRSFMKLNSDSKKISNLHFVWITDGYNGWNSAKNILKESYASIEFLFNLNDLQNNLLSDEFNRTK